MKAYVKFDIWLERLCLFVVVECSVAVAFLLRFDFALPDSVIPMLKQALLIAAILKLPSFEFTGLYRGLRRFVGTPDLYVVFLGNIAGSVLFTAVSMTWIGTGMPRSVLIIDAMVCFVVTALVRFSVRLYEETFCQRHTQKRTGVLIYGAGATGAELVREIRSNRCGQYEVKGFLDDDPSKLNGHILGIPVLGAGRQAASIVQHLNRRNTKVEEIILAMPSATGPEMREALANCRSARIPCMTVPGIDELLSGRVLFAQLRTPAVQDLLGRQPVRPDESRLQQSITGRSILVTGAAGSIGSELCREIARYSPACLVAFDQAESELFKVENELRQKYHDLGLVVALGNIREIDRVSEVLRTHGVDSIFHAAAYKHVPMMESHLLEAVSNNILGTWNLVRAARNHGVQTFLMISSDKAVNPICVMGATKRVCERIVSARRTVNEKMKCASVRFGNVLGSNGSVVPIFQAQIAAGGPVKVTHPEARRYFMTVTEAVSLVVQASTTCNGSEIFILDMGEPVRIVDLAENMIRLAGKVPYEDIDIEFTGLRPGEKLTEELRGKDEALSHTPMDKLHVIREMPLAWDNVDGWIQELTHLMETRRESQVLAHIRRLVPEYSPVSTRMRRSLEMTAIDSVDGMLSVS